MRRRAVKTLRGFHQGFRKRRVGMDGIGDISRRRPYFHREHAFTDQLAGADAGDTDAKDALGLGLNDQLG